MSTLRPTVLLVVCSVAVACSSERGRETSSQRDRDSASAQAGVSVEATTNAADTATRRTPTFAEGADGSVSMATRSGAFVLSLRHDSVVVAFSDSLRQSVKRDVSESMKKDAPKRSDIGAAIQGVVEKSVAATMTEVFDKARGFPLASLRDISYEDGGIHFTFSKTPTWSFDSFKTDGTPLLEQFQPADAARFVGAVRARLKERS